MAIRMRRGIFSNFDASKLLAGELAVVLSGDPDVTDGKAMYVCFAAGDVKRVATWEDAAQLIAEQLPESYGLTVASGTTDALTVTSTSAEDSTSFTISHVAQTSSATAGLDPYASSVGSNTSLGSTTLTDGASFFVPCVSYDAYGHVTGISYRKFTLSSSGVASLTKLGKVIPDGTTIGIDSTGMISVLDCPNALQYKGTSLPSSPSTGDFCVVDGVSQFYNGSAWVEVAPDLSAYVTETELTTALADYVTSDALTTILADYAPLDSPALTGTPTAPTAETGTDSTQVATTGFVQQEIDANAYTHPDSGVTSGTYGDTANQAPAFGGTFNAISETVDAQGHVTEAAQHTVTIPATEATTSAAGLMSASDKSKLDGVEASANNYELPTMSASTKGGAMLGSGLAVANDVLSVDTDAVGIDALQTDVQALKDASGTRWTDDPAVFSSWSSAAQGIADGYGKLLFPIASQFIETWAHKASSSATETEYDNVFDVMHHGTGTLQDATEIPVMFAQMHYCLPFDTQFSPYQAFLYAIDGLPAGTYNVTMGFSWGSKVVSGKTYQFTLVNALPAGGQLCGFYGAPDQNPTNWRVYAFANQTTTTATETVSVSEGSGGTSLGTFTAAGAQVVPASGTPASYSSVTISGTSYTYYGLNSLHRVAYGNNRWLHSPLRQYLNSTGFDWWTPQTVFDRPPAYAAYRGFMGGFSDEFLSVVQPIARKTALSYAVDGGTSGSPEYDTTYDYFTLPSGIEHNLQDTSTYGGGQGQEGVAWDWWKRAAGSSSPLAWGGTYPEYIQYDLAAHATARSVWVRSCTRNSGHNVTRVTTSGYCHGNDAINGRRGAAACAIG